MEITSEELVRQEQNERVLRIKADGVRIQEKDIEDQLKNIESENMKSTIIIGFIGAMASLIPNSKDITFSLKITLFVLFLLPLVITLYNIFSKRVFSHRDIDDCFVNRTTDIEAYFNSCHLALKKNYKSISDLLLKKRILTGSAYIATTTLVMTILLIKLF